LGLEVVDTCEQLRVPVKKGSRREKEYRGIYFSRPQPRGCPAAIA
jgi:hypothetical protein